MTLEELRNRIDVLDRQLVELLNERARAAPRGGTAGHERVFTGNQLPPFRCFVKNGKISVIDADAHLFACSTTSSNHRTTNRRPIR